MSLNLLRNQLGRLASHYIPARITAIFKKRQNGSRLHAYERQTAP